jgi:hypothetical protein
MFSANIYYIHAKHKRCTILNKLNNSQEKYEGGRGRGLTEKFTGIFS